MVSKRPRLVGADKAAAITGLSHWTIRAWAAKGKIASHKLGRRLMFDTVELDRFVQESARPRVARELRSVEAA